tara:strand:+ start:1817 stop:6052 length:4236 start_codon:yes stop_codon:yes gene_type:complete
MAIDKITPRQLNKDEDYLLVKSTEMVDALNVRTTEDADGNRGVLKNIKGNTEISISGANALPTGTNRIIGTCSFNQKDLIFYFVWNSNNNHCIYQIDTSSTALKALTGSFLQFSATSIIHSNAIEDANKDILLYWTDGVNETKKVNISKCLDSGVTYPAGSTDTEKLIELTIAKQPPSTVITHEYRTDNTINSNSVYEQTFQFAYQYIYRDGEISALSPYSTMAYSPWMANRANIKPPYTTADNFIRLTMNTSTAAVEKVRLLVRANNIDTFALVKDIDVTTPGTAEVFDFYNDGLYPLIATNESDKTYDAVPKNAQAMTISNNRLFMGNYTEGFDHYTPANVSLSAHYLETPIAVNATITKETDEDIDIDLSGMPNVINGKRSVFIKLLYDYNSFFYSNASGVGTITVVDGTSTKDYNVTSVRVNPGAVEFFTEIELTNDTYTRNQFGQLVATTISNLSNVTVSAGYNDSTNNDRSTYFTSLTTVDYLDLEGTLTFGFFSSSYDTSTKKINVELGVKSHALRAVKIDDTTFGLDSSELFENSFSSNLNGLGGAGIIPSLSFVSTPIDVSTTSTFKSNADHSFGLVYYDDRGRASGVRDIGSVNISPWGNPERINKNGSARVVVDIPTDAPSTASSYSIVYAKNNRYLNYQQYSVMEALKADNKESSEVGATVGSDNIYLSLASSQGKEDSYSSSKASGFKLQAAAGDKVRIVRYYDRAIGTYIYPQNHEFEVVGIKTYNLDNTPFTHLTGGTSDDHKKREYRVTGDFLVLRNEAYEGFAFSDLTNVETAPVASERWHSAVTIEVYTPLKSTETKLYYEMGYNFPVNSSRKHVGGEVTVGDVVSLTVTNQTTNTLTVSTGSLLSIVPGEYIRFTSGEDGTTYQVANIEYQANSATFTFIANLPANQSTVYWTASVSRTILKNGDAYLVPRELRYHSRTVGYVAQTFDNKVFESAYVEADCISDYFSSDVFSYGKPYAIIDNEKEVTRKASVTYSDPYNQSSKRLTLSNFTPANIPFYDFDVSKGGIYGLVDMKNYIMGLQEDSVMKIPVGANILDSASGDNIPTISTNVLARPIEYQGVFGINTQRDAFISFEGAVFLADIYRGKVWKVTSQSVAEISSNGMSSYFNSKFSEFKTHEGTNTKVFIKLGFDRENKELIVSGVKSTGVTFTNDFTVSYNFRKDLWSSFYSFVGEGYAELNNVLYSFKDGKAYSHNTNSNRNSFYGTTYTSKIEIVSNQNPSMVKAWEALNIESDTSWSFTAYTSDQTASQITTLTQKERMFYSHIPRDTSSISTSQFMTLGEVTSIDSNDDVVIGNPINKIPFNNGDAVYADGVDTSEVMTTLTARNKFVMSDSSVLSVGDVVSVKKNSDLEGDQLRDRYIKIKLEKSTSSPIELYGVGVVFDRSRLHNDLVN